MNKENKFFRDPFEIPLKAGESEEKISLRYVERLRNTSAAIQKLANQDIKDTENYTATNKDDYTHSVEDILKVLDNFIRESNNKTNIERTDFDLLNPQELTLYLLWQIRNVLTHNGAGFIDPICKTKYEKAFSEAKLHGCKPSFDLPEYLEEDKQIHISFAQKDYLHIIECLRTYIEPKVSSEEYHIFMMLLSGVPNRVELENITLRLDNEKISINPKYYKNLQEAGMKIDYLKNHFFYPYRVKYHYNTEELVLANGKSVPAKLIGKRFHNINLDNSINKYMTIKHNKLVLRINTKEAYSCRVRFNFITKRLVFPGNYKYDMKTERFILEDGRYLFAPNVFNCFEPTHPLASQF